MGDARFQPSPRTGGRIFWLVRQGVVGGVGAEGFGPVALGLFLALSLAAAAAGGFGLPLLPGIAVPLASAPVLLALARLGPRAGLASAALGAGAAWFLWSQPLAGLLLVAEAAGVARHRTHCARRGRPPPPLAVSVALFWATLGLPLAVVLARVGLGADWAEAGLLAVRHALGGILGGALAGAVPIAAALLARRRTGLPLSEVLFAALLAGILAGMLLPTLLIGAWAERTGDDRPPDGRPTVAGPAPQVPAGLPAAILAVALLGAWGAGALSRRLAGPLQGLAAAAEALPAAIAEDRPWSVPVAGLLAETGQLAAAVSAMGSALAGGFRSLRAEKDEQARQRELLDLQAEILRALVSECDDERSFALRLAAAVGSRLPGHRVTLVRPDRDGAPRVLAAQGLDETRRAALERMLCESPCQCCCGQAIASAGPVAVPDTAAEVCCPRPGPEDPLPMRACLAVPIPGREGTTLGALAIGSPTLGTLDPFARALIDTAATLAGHGLESIALRRHHEVLVEALSQAGTGVTFASRDGDDFPLTYVNRGFETLTGYRADELLGRDCRFLQGEDRNQPGRDALREALAAGRSCRTVLRNYRKDGSPFWVEIELSPMRDWDGKVTHFIGIQQDVTESVETLERLKHSEASLLEAQANAHLGSWVLDLARNESEWSQETYRLLGYAPGAVAPTPESFFAVVPPEERMRVRAAVELARSDPEGRYRIEHRVQGPDGVERILLEQGRVGFDASGEPVRYAGTSLDVTERHRAEEALRAQEERYRLVIDNVEDLVLRVDMSSRVELANRAYCRTFGLVEGEIRGQVALPEIHPDDLETTRRAIGDLKRPPYVCTVAHRARTPQGWRWFEWVDRTVLDGEGRPVAVVAVGRDVHERKQAEAALRESEERFRRLFETMGEGVVYQLADGSICDANPAAERILGVSLEDLCGRDSDDPRWQAMREDGTPYPGTEHPSMLALRTGREQGRTVMGIRNPREDRVRWLQVHARPEIRPGESEPYRAFATFSDITRLKTAELHLSAILENAPNGILRVDAADRRILWCNTAMRRLFGYGPGELEGEPIDCLHPPEAMERVLPDFARRAAALGESLEPTLDMPCRRKDGGLFYCVIATGTIRLGAERIIVALFTDVTADYRARRALERSEQALLKAQEQAQLGSWELEIATDRLTWSPEVYRIFELDPQRFGGRNAEALAVTHPEDRESVLAAYLQSVADRRPHDLVHRLWMPDGRIKWVHERCEHEYAPDGTPLRSVGTVQDITQRMTARLALLEERQRLANVIDATRVGTWEWDIPSDRLVVNARWSEILGYRTEELMPLGRERVRGLVHPEDLEQADALLARHLAGEIDNYECELRMRHRNGHWVWVQAHGRLLERDAAGAPLVMAGVQRDIGERKRAELALIEREAMIGELLALAARFLHGGDRQLKTLIRNALARVGRFARADRCVMCELDASGSTLDVVAEWSADGIAPKGGRTQDLALAAVPRLAASLRAGDPIEVARVAELGADWQAERALWEAMGARSVLGVALSAEGRLLGSIHIDSVRAPRDWSHAEVRFLQVLASMLSGSIVRARAMADLRASNARYDALARQSRTFTWEVDAEGRYTYLSSVTEDVLGYAPRELIGTSCYDLVPEDARASLRALAEPLLAAGKPLVDISNPLLTKDGRRLWVVTNGVPILAEDGSLAGYRGTDTDITDRYLAQERIQESQARLSALIENAPIGIALVGADRRLRLANRALAAFLGRPQADLIGTRLDAASHPDDLDAELKRFGNLLAGRTDSYRTTQRYLRPDKRTVWGDQRVALLPTRPGEPPAPLVMVEDISELHAATERQQALEAALTDYAAQLEALVDIANLSLPSDEQIEALLRLGCRGLGLAAAVLARVEDGGQRHRPLAAFCEDGRHGPPPLPRTLLAETLATPGAPRAVGIERLPRSAPAAGFRSCVGLVFDGPRPDGGADPLILALWGDASAIDLRDPERQILRLIAQRVAAVLLRSRMEKDLVEARERETIGHLASGVAHDFNNLLGVIDANIHYLDVELDALGGADREIREVLDETRSALGHAKVITSGMLALSRAGGVPLETVELGPLVEELARILVHVLSAAIELKIEIAPGLTVWSNGAFLQSALLNLALNARDAMPDGGHLTIGAVPARWDGTRALAVGAPEPMDCVELAVSDTGTGIDPAILGRIFDPLFSTKARRRGHGLGLFMVAELIGRSGAGLAVESEPGAGTRFTLILPTRALPAGTAAGASGRAEAGTPVPPATGPATARKPLDGLRVLVVDDDPRVGEAVARLLALEGAKVALAENGRACLERLASDPGFDLVLSDIAMPELDGIDLARRLVRERPGLPVVLMTGEASGAVDPETLVRTPLVLRKPLNPGALLAAILERTGRTPG